MTGSVPMVAALGADDDRPGATMSIVPSGHNIRCPCGCGQRWYAPHRVVSGSVETGDLTLTPSLFMTGGTGCGWHGYLRDGVFTPV